MIAELKKIEQRKKEREKKTQDLQKLITAADSSMDARRSERKATKKKPPQLLQRVRDGNVSETCMLYSIVVHLLFNSV